MLDAFPPNEGVPEWLRGRLFGDGFDWNAAQSTTLPRFLEEYTLHDSIVRGFWCEPFAKRGCLIVSWDSFWNRERIPHPSSKVGTWPILLIYFPTLHQVVLEPSQYDDLHGIVMDMTTRELSAEEYQQGVSALHAWIKVSENRPEWMPKEVQHTTVETVAGADYHLLHGPEVRLLCIDYTGRQLIIPDLEHKEP